MKKLSKNKVVATGKTLSAEQLAVSELMCAAVREYSESRYAAGWYSDIEHSLWDEVILRKEDAYERACVRLHKLAKKPCWRRPRKRSLFSEGLKILSERYEIWFFYESRKGERAISVQEWRLKHESWIATQIRKRWSYEKVWELAHHRLFEKKQPKVPPMPKIKLPPIDL